MNHFWLIIHLLWISWMIVGIALAIAGFWRPSLWRMPVFRTTHLLALFATATVPIWGGGICPITNWEQGDSAQPEPLLSRLISALVYWDIPQYILSILTAVLALATLAIYIAHPPWRTKRRI